MRRPQVMSLTAGIKIRTITGSSTGPAAVALSIPIALWRPGAGLALTNLFPWGAGEQRITLAVVFGFDAWLGIGNVERSVGAELSFWTQQALGAEEAEVANAAWKLLGKTKEKAAYELVGGQRHRLGLVFGAIILPPGS